MNGDSTATNVTTASAGGGMANFYEDIAGSDSQGFDPTTAADGLDAYTNALDLIANQALAARSHSFTALLAIPTPLVCPDLKYHTSTPSM